MEPSGISQYLFPVYPPFFNSCNRAIFSIIINLGRTNIATCFQIEDPHTLTTSLDMINSHLMPTKSYNATLSNRIIGQTSNIICFNTIISKRYGHIGFCTSIADLKFICLYKFEIIWSS